MCVLPSEIDLLVACADIGAALLREDQREAYERAREWVALVTREQVEAAIVARCENVGN